MILYNKQTIRQVLLMGSSKSKPGIYIKTQKPFYLPGDTVQGCVYVNAPQPFPTANIVLSITGLEKTWWRENATRRNEPQSPDSNQSLASMQGFKPNSPKIPISGDRSGECKIIEASFILNNWGSNKASLQGQYAFPFEFQLPHYVPGSFREEKSDYRASVVYEIQCKCVSSKKREDDVVVTQQLIIREPKKNNEESLYGEVYLYPQTCCCFKNGVSRVCCYFEKNQYVPGEECIAICEADNYKCKLKIKEIKVKFKKVLTLTSGFGEQNVFQQQINQASFPGVRPHEQYTGPNAKKISIPLKYRDSKSSIHPSTNGRLVKCHYYLEVMPQMSGWCLKNVKSFRVNLNILHEAQGIIEIEQPQSWNPEVYAKSQIMIEQNFSNDFIDGMGNKNYF